SASRERDRTTAASHSAKSCSGESSAAECHSQSGSAFQSTVSHGGCRSWPYSDLENQLSSTKARCLSNPPRVIDEAPTVALRPAASSPAHFHARVARWYSRKPRRVAVSLPASGGSGRPCSSRSL